MSVSRVPNEERHLAQQFSLPLHGYDQYTALLAAIIKPEITLKQAPVFIQEINDESMTMAAASQEGSCMLIWI